MTCSIFRPCCLPCSFCQSCLLLTTAMLTALFTHLPAISWTMRHEMWYEFGTRAQELACLCHSMLQVENCMRTDIWMLVRQQYSSLLLWMLFIFTMVLWQQELMPAALLLLECQISFSREDSWKGTSVFHAREVTSCQNTISKVFKDIKGLLKRYLINCLILCGQINIFSHNFFPWQQCNVSKAIFLFLKYLHLMRNSMYSRRRCRAFALWVSIKNIHSQFSFIYF